LDMKVRGKMKKTHMLFLLVIFFTFLFMVDVGSKTIEPNLFRDPPYTPFWFELLKYFPIALAICGLVWCSLTKQPQDKLVTWVYIFSGAVIFLSFTFSGYFLLSSAFVIPDSLHNIYTAATSSKSGFIKMGASIVAVLGLLRLFYKFKK